MYASRQAASKALCSFSFGGLGAASGMHAQNNGTVLVHGFTEKMIVPYFILCTSGAFFVYFVVLR